VRGDASVLEHPLTALFCSKQCPGNLILETFDLVRALRDEGVLFISGFHSPMEKDCLKILLRSPHPVVWCLARGMLKNIPAELRPAIDDGRLVMVSPFPDTVLRPTAETAQQRNRVVATLAKSVIVPYAAPDNTLEPLCLEMLSKGKPVFTFDDEENRRLLETGAQPITSAMAFAEREKKLL